MKKMKAKNILFLGNSISLHGPYNTWVPNANWGMAASAEGKDYVHLLASAITARTDRPLRLAPTTGASRWYPGNPIPTDNTNILNMADLFERNYATWDNARFQTQIEAKPDIVILQFGENMSGGTMPQFKTALQTLMAGLKESSNPHIFVTGFILGANPTIDGIKKEVCAEDPSHRVFVDMSQLHDPKYLGQFGHPSDEGMNVIANNLFNAMEAHCKTTP
ncbi:MAG: SGNH/GDSL hydrolase family protein [bacterium]